MNKKLPSLSCLIICLFFLLSFKQTFSQVYETPAIKAGTATVTGTITSAASANKNVVVEVIVPHPISGEYVKYKVIADQAGKFSLSVEVETSVSLAALSTSVEDGKFLLVKLISDGTTQVNIAYNPRDFVESISSVPAMNQNDMLRAFEVNDELIAYRADRAPEPWHERNADAYLNYIKLVYSEHLYIANDNPFISKEQKDLLTKNYRLILYSSHAFDYENEMMRYYHALGDESKEPGIQKVDRSYFRFLRDFDLNDPQYLNCFHFLEFQQQLFQNTVLAIPEIGESDIATWMANVKGFLADLVGFKDGRYYDIMAANAYAKQFNEQVKPLTEKQKQNIRNYWKDGEIAKILFRKNDQVVELDKLKSPLVVHDVASVPVEKMIETILAKYPGKVVFIDLWATWCGPCLEAMKDFRTAKGSFKDKDVVFVYLTNTSSPQKLWKEKTEGIGGEHYYLNAAQWEYIMDHFGFDAIPSYLLYNKKGELVKQFTAFPGSDEVKGMIDGEL